MPGPLVAIFHQAPRDGDPAAHQAAGRGARACCSPTSCRCSSVPGRDAWRCCPAATPTGERRVLRGAARAAGRRGAGRRPRPHRHGQRRGAAAANARMRAASWPPPARGPSASRSPTTATRRTYAPSRTPGRSVSCRRSPPTTPCPAGSRRSPASRSASCRAETGSRSTSTRPSTWRCCRWPAASRRRCGGWPRHPASPSPASTSCGSWPPTPGASCWWRARAARARCVGWSATSRAACGSCRRSAGCAPRPATARPPRSSLGRLLALRGARRPCRHRGRAADGAIIDSRVLLADRLGADEAPGPRAEDRFASDLLRPDASRDAWLAELTRAAAQQPVPILLGAHTIVGPGVPLLLARPHSTGDAAGPETSAAYARMRTACDAHRGTSRPVAVICARRFASVR